MSSNRDKKKIFTQRARLGKGEKEDSSRLSIGRFANERNKVYVSKKKIELHNKEKSFKTKYDKFSKKLENNSNMTDIYEQYQDNDPMSRFGVGDDSKYSKLENKKRNNNNKNNKNNNNNNNDEQDENVNNDSDIVQDDKNNKNNNNKEKKNIKSGDGNNLNKNKKDGDNEDDTKKDNSNNNKDKEEPSIQAQFKNAKYQFEKEKKEKQEFFKQMAEKKEKLRKHIHEKNKEKFGSILKKTKKGQPIMSNQINKLLSKIMDNK
ncbi:hypothetical protein DDB_G0284173 [Dictyostelium discoideum AX4]|uniref:rRNA-processing protein FYV7 n=1 Tax=Dictyostelium discoideum TaxID=44689 RepID=Q54Q15_DICDI|nr:hypothetical protein DDB_G0284173 [Dictyostelium discoideum AX4]EAL65354.1 hypothetical protein DDB_G0284173 [Dictyostelium discoideum AX4]|eukprot:XP_638709.1 hypothetical protein DDB_G0284173 [Dictyostelium discoideum AX4]